MEKPTGSRRRCRSVGNQRSLRRRADDCHAGNRIDHAKVNVEWRRAVSSASIGSVWCPHHGDPHREMERQRRQNRCRKPLHWRRRSDGGLFGVGIRIYWQR